MDVRIETHFHFHWNWRISNSFPESRDVTVFVIFGSSLLLNSFCVRFDWRQAGMNGYDLIWRFWVKQPLVAKMLKQLRYTHLKIMSAAVHYPHNEPSLAARYVGWINNYVHDIYDYLRSSPPPNPTLRELGEKHPRIRPEAGRCGP